MGTDSQIRTDPLTGDAVIFAADRAARPNEFAGGHSRREPSDCPFCIGSECETPTAVYTLPEAGSGVDGHWQVRVVPNKYPALAPIATEAMPCTATGVHEVFIESPEHIVSFSEISLPQARLVFRAYRDRIRAASDDSRIRFVQLFKNARPIAGASLEHIHSQLIGMMQTPARVASRLDCAKKFYDQEQCCYYCNLLDSASQGADRVVAASELMTALCPFASRFPYETWIIPAKHASRFEELDDEQLSALADLTQSIVKRIEHVMGSPAYNIILRTAPFDLAAEEYYHWHVEITPRIASIAGFECATGCFINSVFPENAARELRNVG